MRFTTTVELGGKNATGLPVPEAVVLGFGRGKRVSVRVSVRGHTYRSTVGPYGGAYMLPLSAENRGAAGVRAGDEVEVELEVDDAPRSVDVPADLQTALDADPAAQAAFSALSFSNQSRHVLAVEGAKTAATRERRLAKVLTELHPPA